MKGRGGDTITTTKTGTRPTSRAISRHPLPRSFYLRPTLTVARELLGKLLVRDTGRTLLAGRITEVEAYLGRHDPASHSFRGRTPRNSVMFAEGGRLYVYFTYGMHFCANVVTEEEGKGCAVLLRGVEPLEGLPLMARRRKIPGERITDLCDGPAKLCQAFAIRRPENGTDLCGDKIWITHGRSRSGRKRIVRTPRIGIRQGKEKLWRFLLAEPPATRRHGPS